jgi:Lrp/AsnC family transcriptional regulator for asnA, asnC and gidA
VSHLIAVIDLDDIDRRLIAALSEDGRAAMGELGAKVGLSGDAVRERLRRLQRDGVVSVVGTPDPAALGYHTVALVGVRVSGPVAPVAAQIAEVAEVDLLTMTFGEFELLVEVLAHDEEHLLELLDERIRALPGVVGCSVFLYLGVLKWAPGGLATVQPPNGVAPPAVTLDDTDRALLRELQRDGRASFQDLATATGLSYAHARRRAHALITSGAVRIITTVNRVATGGAVMAAVGLRVTGPVDRVVEGLRAIAEVEVAVQTSGAFDVFVEVACRDRERLRTLVGEEIRAVEGVTASETFVYGKLLKLPVQWSADALVGAMSAAPGSPA